MSGPDNLRGIDYQLSYTVLEILLLLRDPANRVRSIRFDSLTDDEDVIHDVLRATAYDQLAASRSVARG